MDRPVTLILILHNRHKNLDRQLDYYKDFSSPIIIADSSENKHQLRQGSNYIKHVYTPGKTFAQKIESVLEEVQTEFVVMCADDDFIIPQSIYDCVDFLGSNKEYSVAQGNCIRFYRSSLALRDIQYDLVYEIKSYDVESDDPFFRLRQMFRNYRSVLYAVHRTDILRLAYRNAGSVVHNLFLHEYLTAIVPVFSGKYKEFPFLYQVREFAEGSDDKLTDNLNVIFNESRYESELANFIDQMTENVSSVIPAETSKIRGVIETVLKKFSESPLIGNHPKPMHFKKRVGGFIRRIPLIGEWLIQKSREMERKKSLDKALGPNDFKHLSEIETALKRHPV